MYLYILWFTGTLSVLLYKYISYITYGKKPRTKIKRATFDWFFEPSLLNAASWLATLSASWLGSAVYIDKVPFPLLFELLGPLHHHASIALFLGVTTELVAPFVTKWIITKADAIINLIK